MASLGLSQQARIDLLNIAQYGAAQWGAEAADTFLVSFDKAFARIERHPEIGRPRAELGPHARSWLHRGYVLYYEHGAGVFEVRRVLHAAADPDLAEDEL